MWSRTGTTSVKSTSSWQVTWSPAFLLCLQCWSWMTAAFWCASELKSHTAPLCPLESELDGHAYRSHGIWGVSALKVYKRVPKTTITNATKVQQSKLSNGVKWPTVVLKNDIWLGTQGKLERWRYLFVFSTLQGQQSKESLHRHDLKQGSNYRGDKGSSATLIGQVLPWKPTLRNLGATLKNSLFPVL